MTKMTEIMAKMTKVRMITKKETATVCVNSHVSSCSCAAPMPHNSIVNSFVASIVNGIVNCIVASIVNSATFTIAFALFVLLPHDSIVNSDSVLVSSCSYATQ